MERKSNQSCWGPLLAETSRPWSAGSGLWDYSRGYELVPSEFRDAATQAWRRDLVKYAIRSGCMDSTQDERVAPCRVQQESQAIDCLFTNFGDFESLYRNFVDRCQRNPSQYANLLEFLAPKLQQGTLDRQIRRANELRSILRGLDTETSSWAGFEAGEEETQEETQEEARKRK